MRFATVSSVVGAVYKIVDDLDASTLMPVDVWMPGGPPIAGDRVLYDVVDGQVVVLADVTGAQQGIPGEIRMFGNSTPPPGWLMCDGTSQLRTTYPRLFAVIGTTFGSVDGTHFNVPDFGGRFPSGVTPVGQQGGANTHVHPLSDAGGAAIQFSDLSTNGVLHRRTGLSFTSTHKAAESANTVTAASAATVAAGLVGNTDSANLVPLYTRVAFIVKT